MTEPTVPNKVAGRAASLLGLLCGERRARGATQRALGVGYFSDAARCADVAPRSRSQLTSCSRRVSVLPATSSAV